MVKEIIHDPIFLARKSVPATENDVGIADDLTDTLKANEERCVGMAANMIGESVRIIVYRDGDAYGEMFNPEIIGERSAYETEEGCLSLDGVRKTKRYRVIRVKWYTRDFKPRVKAFEGFTAQIIQHEIDHLNGILI